MKKKPGRDKPYTAVGISRLKCHRCEKRKATQQWDICSDGNLYRPVCDVCDILLNLNVLKFMNFEEVEKKIAGYVTRFDRDVVDEVLAEIIDLWGETTSVKEANNLIKNSMSGTSC